MNYVPRILIASAASASLALVLASGGRAATTATSFSGSEGALGFNNTSATGSALEGTVSTSGQTSIQIPFGILGEYEASSSTFGIGVAAVSTSGYGVAAEAFGNAPAMLGLASGSGGAMIVSSSGTGMEIQTYNAGGAIVSAAGSSTAVAATSTTGITVLATSDGGDAGQFQSLAEATGQYLTGGAATLGRTDGIGAAAYGYGESPVLSVIAENSGDVFDGVNDGGSTTFAVSGSTADKSGYASGGSDVAIEGDVFLHGAYYVCQPGCNAILTAAARNAGYIATRNGAVDSYRATQSEPTIEDSGEARMTAGIAFVRFDPAYAKMLSSAASYDVFLTPEGSTRGLYVAGRSRDGFTVREHGAGHSTVNFSYRIAARSASSTARFAPSAVIRSPLYGRAAYSKPKRLFAQAAHIAIPTLR